MKLLNSLLISFLAKAGFEIITITIKENNIKQHSVCIIKE